MNPIRTNKPVFFGDDGEVLKSGSIYIGQPNQWPLDFPKTVTLQDSAGSQLEASQPLKTNNQGRIEYNGKSVMALVDGDYSILVRDRNGVTVGEGYTPFVADSAGSGGGTTEGVTQVGLLLSDIKQFDVTPGDTVRNVGKDTALDGLGADWLVVSNTGSSGDDEDLIDFANGLQGERLNSVVYSKNVNWGELEELVAGSSSQNVALPGPLKPGFHLVVFSPQGDTLEVSINILVPEGRDAYEEFTSFVPSSNESNVTRVRYSQSSNSFVVESFEFDLGAGTITSQSPEIRAIYRYNVA